MTKLTLQETVSLLVKNGFPLEVIPGKTHKSVRHHLLVIHEELPQFYIVFGDAAHGSLFDSAYVSSRAGEHIRIKEADVRAVIEKPVEISRWTRAMPAAPNPVTLSVNVLNSDLAKIEGVGHCVGKSDKGLKIKLLGSTQVLELETNFDVETGSTLGFNGTYRFPNRVTDVTLI